MSYEAFCKRFGYKLKYYRNYKGLTQEELAEKLEISDYHYVSKIESGKCNITFKTLFKLSQALDTEPFNFFQFK